VTKEIRVILELKVFKERPVLLEPLELKGYKVYKVKPVRPEPQATRVIKVTLEPRATREIRERLELLVLRVQ
tara:strand:+ start:221 stop:436 length:216 start_codon:yes stop_codon:yes gene_type:complete